jgi:peptidoglycan hydrolase CwlO-like protein
MTPAEISQYAALALALIALAGHLKTWLSSGEKDLEKTVKSLAVDAEATEKKVIEHDRRIQGLEAEMKHLPSKDAVHQLQLDLTELKGYVATLAESAKATQQTTRRVEEFLLARPN